MEHQRHLGGFIRSISNAMTQQMRQNSERLGLTSSQGMFLHHIWFYQEIFKRPIHARDLEEFFDIKHSTVSGILQRMEAAGFVGLRSNEADRRCKSIYLTPKALEIHAQTEAHIRDSEATLVQNMTETDIGEFRRLLQIAATNLGVCVHPPIFPKEDSNL